MDSTQVSPIPHLLCNESSNAANATGVYSFQPGIPQFNSPSGAASTPTYAITLTASWPGFTNGTTELAIWYDSGDADYNDDLGLGYDACSIILPFLTNNTILRAQRDNGTCLSALDAECVQSLQSVTEAAANTLAQSPSSETSSSPSGQTSPEPLSHVCDSIANKLIASFPTSCAPYFSNASALADIPSIALTSSNSSYSYAENSCTMNNTFVPLLSEVESTSNDYSNAYYDIFAYTPWPILTVFLPVDNVQRHVWIQNAKTSMTCVRVNEYQDQARIPPSLPSADKVAASSHYGGLSKGAIAGIVVGILVAVLFAILLLALFVRHRRRMVMKMTEKTTSFEKSQGVGVNLMSQDPETMSSQYSDMHHSSPPSKFVRELPGTSKDEPVFELPPKSRVAEIEGSPVQELDSLGSKIEGVLVAR